MNRYKQEIKQLLQATYTWPILGIVLLAPLLVSTHLFGLVPRAYGTTLTSMFVQNPAKLSLYIGAFGVVIYTLLALQQIYRSKAYTLVESSTNPVSQMALRTLGILGLCTVASIVGQILAMPYAAVKLGQLFGLVKYLKTWIYIYTMGLVVVVLLTSGVYLLFRNFEVSLLLVSILMIYSISLPREAHYTSFWLQTARNTLSDGTQSLFQFRVIGLGRLISLVGALGIYALGLLSVRRYGRGMVVSMLQNMRHAVLPIVLAICIAAVPIYMQHDPLTGNYRLHYFEEVAGINPNTKQIEWYGETYDEYLGKLQQSSFMSAVVRWKTCDVELLLEGETLQGKSTYTLEDVFGLVEEQGNEELTIEILQGIEVTKILLDGTKLEFYKDTFAVEHWQYYHFVIPKGKMDTLEIMFAGTPKGANNEDTFTNRITKDYAQFDKEATPRLKTKSNETQQYTLYAPAEKEVFVLGCPMEEVASKREGYRAYTFETERYRNMYGFRAVVGDYVVQTAEVAGQEVQFAQFKGKTALVEKGRSMELITDVISFMTETFGPLETYGMPIFIWEPEMYLEVEEANILQQFNGNGSYTFINGLAIKEAEVAGSFTENIEDNVQYVNMVWTLVSQWWNTSGIGANVYEGLHPTLYSTYLYLKERHGQDYADTMVRQPAIQWAKEYQGAFYGVHEEELIEKIPFKNALEIYGNFQYYGEKERQVGVLFYMVDLIGEEEVTRIWKEGYELTKGGYPAWLKSLIWYRFDMFLEEACTVAGITMEEAKAGW
ncbi:MAG: hypothetical protein ACOX3W_07920 [Christensenellaceae bacterium]|jgi:hypothetical protein